MEPEILARPDDAPSSHTDWTASTDHPARDHTVDSATTTGTGHSVLMKAAATTAHAPGWTRTNGTSHTNGHAKPNGNGHAHAPHRASISRTTAAPATYAPAIPFETPQEEGVYLRLGKRLIDVVGSAVALVIASPVLLAAALAIKFESRGPVLYRSTRIGRGGRPFTFYKLRSMVKDAEQSRHHLTHLNEADGPIFKISRDPRVTRVGRWLRTSSIDEIPQFLNVLSGEMSLVGPRPPLPDEVSQYEPWQLRRLDVRPGITCLWQISGRSRIGFEEWMRLDLEYIKHQSLALDTKILLRTIPAVLSREGAY